MLENLIKIAIPTDEQSKDLTAKACHNATLVLASNSDYIMRYFYHKRDGAENDAKVEDWDNFPALEPFNLPTQEELVIEDGEQVKYLTFDVDNADSKPILGLLRQGFYADGTMSDYSLGNLFTIIKNLMDDRDNQSNFLRIYYAYSDLTIRAIKTLNTQNGFEIVNLLLNLTKSQIFSDNPIASCLLRYRLKDYERVFRSVIQDEDPEGALNILIELAKNHNQIWDSQFFIERVLVRDLSELLGALALPETSLSKRTGIIRLIHHLVEAVVPENQQSERDDFNMDNSPLMSRLRGGGGIPGFGDTNGSLNLNIPEVTPNSEEQLIKVLEAIQQALPSLNQLLTEVSVSVSLTQGTSRHTATNGVESTRVGFLRLSVFKLVQTLINLQKTWLNTRMVESGILSSMQELFLSAGNHTILHNLYVKLWQNFFNAEKFKRQLRGDWTPQLDPVCKWFIGASEETGCLQLVKVWQQHSELREQRKQAEGAKRGKPNPKWNYLPHIHQLLEVIHVWMKWAESAPQMQPILKELNSKNVSILQEILQSKFIVDKETSRKVSEADSEENDPFNELNQHEADSGTLEAAAIQTEELIIEPEEVEDVLGESTDQHQPGTRDSTRQTKSDNHGHSEDDPWNHFNDYSPDEVSTDRPFAEKFSNNSVRVNPEESTQDSVIIEAEDCNDPAKVVYNPYDAEQFEEVTQPTSNPHSEAQETLDNKTQSDIGFKEEKSTEDCGQESTKTTQETSSDVTEHDPSTLNEASNEVVGTQEKPEAEQTPAQDLKEGNETAANPTATLESRSEASAIEQPAAPTDSLAGSGPSAPQETAATAAAGETEGQEAAQPPTALVQPQPQAVQQPPAVAQQPAPAA